MTLDELEKEIISECFINAKDALSRQPESNLPNVPPPPTRAVCLTFCILEMRNGYLLTGESICVNPAIYDAKIAHEVARENAINKALAALHAKEQL